MGIDRIKLSFWKTTSIVSILRFHGQVSSRRLCLGKPTGLGDRCQGKRLSTVSHSFGFLPEDDVTSSIKWCLN